MKESVVQGIDKRGKEVTPWLLKRVGELTVGSALELSEFWFVFASVRCECGIFWMIADEIDVRLIENNAGVGGKVAVELARLRIGSNATGSRYMPSIPSATNTTPTSITASTQRTTSTIPISTIPTSTSTISIPTPVPPPPNNLDPNKLTPTPLPKPQVLVIGSAAIDLSSTSPLPLVAKTTTPGRIHISPGGVGRNIAEAAQNLLPKNTVQLISAVGVERGAESDAAESTSGLDRLGGMNGLNGEDMMSGSVRLEGLEKLEGLDGFGKLLEIEMISAGLRTDGLVRKKGRTSACSLMLEPGGDLVVGVADMGIVESLDTDLVSLDGSVFCNRNESHVLLRFYQVENAVVRNRPKMVVFDCNPTPDVLGVILRTCLAHGIPS